MTSSTTASTSNQIALLNLFLEAGIPVLIWGEPGTAKSAVIESTGGALARWVETVISSLREPADFGGLPVIDGGSVRFAPPAWAQRLAACVGGRGLVFFDEINLAPPAVQGALMRVVLDRVVGDLRLPAGVSVVAAANPPECSAGGWDLSAPLANRFAHIDWEPEAADWIEGMIAGFPPVAARRLPDGWEANLPRFNALVASFIRKNPTALHKLPAEGQAGKAWPSRRSWTATARALCAADALGWGLRSSIAAHAIAALVGDGVGVPFVQFLQTSDLVDPEAALANPATVEIPARGDLVAVFLDAVVAAALHKGTRSPAERAARYAAAGVIVGRVVDRGEGDLALPPATTLASKRDAAWPIPAALGKLVPLLKSAGIV